jgi:hypothetical protein
MSAAKVALFGDWNESPLTTGRYSPAWIAGETGLRTLHAGPGRHGNIDFALTNVRDTVCWRVGNGTRGKRERGSDHDAIVFVLEAPNGSKLRVLLWNVQRDRSVNLALDQLAVLIAVHEPDVIVLNEAAQYVTRLITRYSREWRIIAGDKQVNSQNVLLIQTQRRERVVQLSEDGWTTVGGAEHGPIYSPFVLIDGWLHLGGVHMPPSVRWTRKGKGLPIGPPKRVATYVTAARKLVRMVRRWHAKAAKP